MKTPSPKMLFLGVACLLIGLWFFVEKAPNKSTTGSVVDQNCDRPVYVKTYSQFGNGLFFCKYVDLAVGRAKDCKLFLTDEDEQVNPELVYDYIDFSNSFTTLVRDMRASWNCPVSQEYQN